MLALGVSHEEILANYPGRMAEQQPQVATRPGLTDTDLRACIAYGSEMSRERFVDLPHGA